MTDTTFILTTVSKEDEVTLPALLLLNIGKLLFTVGITGRKQPQIPWQ